MEPEALYGGGRSIGRTLSDDDRAIIAKGKNFDAADQAVQSWRDGITTFKSGAEALRATVASSLVQSAPAPAEPDAAALQAARAEQQSLLAEAQTELDTLIARASGILESSGPESPWRQWAASLAAFKGGYNAAVARSSTHAERMTQLRQIEEQLTRHVRETARLREELRALESAEAVYEAERRAWLALRRERDEFMRAQCASLTASSDGMIRAHVKPYADPSEFVNSLRQFLSGSRVSGGKIEAVGESIASAADGVIQWNAVLTDLEKLAEVDPENEGNARRPETPSLSAAGLTAGEIDRLARSLKPDQWLALTLIPIPSVPVFEYRARENEYIPFVNASAGQQATALLKTLLNQAGPPLIIDQPEEDLDNPVMLEIVEQLWKAKRKRQIIFASHNANLVVNGDAELVAWCDYRTSGDQSRGVVAGEGAIDVANVREAIERIMEGGKAAFNLRREKYGF